MAPAYLPPTFVDEKDTPQEPASSLGQTHQVVNSLTS